LFGKEAGIKTVKLKDGQMAALAILTSGQFF
jgi:hypothetical protein